MKLTDILNADMDHSVYWSCGVSAMIASVLFAFYAYATIPTKSFYVRLIEKNSGVEFVGDVDVRWGWASHPFGFPDIFADRAVDVLILSEEINVESIRNELRYSSGSCTVGSKKASTLYGGIAVEHCWSGLSSSGRDDIYFSISENFNELYFWQR